MALAERLDLGVNELVILDTKAFTGPPVAVVRLPLKLKRESRSNQRLYVFANTTNAASGNTRELGGSVRN
jgi:hypothetical protein